MSNAFSVWFLLLVGLNRYLFGVLIGRGKFVFAVSEKWK